MTRHLVKLASALIIGCTIYGEAFYMVKCHFLRLGTVIPMTIYPPVYDGIIINSPSSRFSNMYFL